MADGKIEFKDLVEKQQILQGWNEMVSEMIKNLDKIKEATIKAGTEAAQGLKGNKMTSGDDLKKYEADINKINEAEKTFNNVKKTQADIMKAVNAATFANKSEIKELTALREKYKQSIKSLNVDLKEDLALLKNGTITQKEYKDRVASTNAQIEKLKIQLRENNHAIKANTTATYAQEGSYKQLAAQYSLNKIALNSMSEAQRRGTEVGRQLEAETLSLRERMNDLQKSTGNYALQVGNYEIAGKDLRLELKNLERQMMGMRRANKENTDAYRTLQNEAGKLKDIMADVRAEVRNTSSDTRKLDVAISVFTTIGSAAQVAQGAVNLLGLENKKVEESIRQMMALQVMMNGINQIRNNLQSSSVLMMAVENTRMKIQTFQTMALARAEAAKLAMTQATTIATKAGAAAQWLLNAAMAANPIGLIVAALAAVAVGLAIFYNRTSDANRESKYFAENIAKINEALKKNDEQLKETNTNFKNYVDNLKDNRDEQTKIIEDTKKVWEKRKKIYEDEKGILERENDKIKENIRLKEEGIATGKITGQAIVVVANEIEKMTAKLNANNKTIKYYNENISTISEGLQKYTDKIVPLIKKLAEKRKKEEEAAEAAKRAAEAAEAATKKRREELKSLREEIENLEFQVSKFRMTAEQIELAELERRYNALFEKAKGHKEEMLQLEDLYNRERINIIIKYINEAFIERQKGYETEKKQRQEALLEMINDINTEFLERLKTQKQNEKKAKELLKQEEEEMLSTVKETTISIVDSYKKRSQEKAKFMNDEIQKSKIYEQQLRQLATKGIEGSTENLAFELRKQAELEKKRQQELKRQKRLELGMSAISAYSNISKSGDKNALGKTISEITKLIAFINSVPEFAEGIIALGGRRSVTQPDDTIAKIGKGESVITAPATNAYYDQLKDMQQMRYNPLDYVELPRFSNYNADNVNFQLLKKVENLSKIIENKTEYKIDIDGLRHEIVETIKTGNTKIINKYKRQFLG